MKDNQIIAQLIDVSKYYGVGAARYEALNKINLTFYRSDITLIEGNSGSGKSTLLHLLGCIDKQDEGRIIIDGKDTTNISLEQLASVRLEKIGFVFQSFNLIPVLTAYENVELPLLFNNTDKNIIKHKVYDVLNKVGLLDLKSHYPRELSGGQQQRVAIARALVGNPSLILADEPTANLDSKTGSEILDLFTSLNSNDGITIIISSHDTVVLERINTVVKLRDGKLVYTNIRNNTYTV
jgi:putative ABC transport system ATP-binding protein